MSHVIAVSAAGRPIGEDSARARYPDETIEALRARVAAGESVAKAARAVGMPYATARDVIRGRRRCTMPAAWVSVNEKGARRVVCC